MLQPAGQSGNAKSLAATSMKYAPLYRHLQRFAGDVWHATFYELETILGFRLPNSARRHQAWWSNTDSHIQAAAWIAAGWETSGVDVAKERLSFVRSQTAATPSTSTSTAGSMARSADGWRARSSHRTTPLKQADRIRFFAAEHFVEPARRDGHQTVTVRAGDIGDRMGLQSNIPNVCNALGGCKFE